MTRQSNFVSFGFGLVAFAAQVLAQPCNSAGVIWTDIPKAPCDSIDFNGNGIFPEDQDVIDFFSFLSGSSCPETNPYCDIDFNNNQVFPEDQDVIDFFNILAGSQDTTSCSDLGGADLELPVGLTVRLKSSPYAPMLMDRNANNGWTIAPAIPPAEEAGGPGTRVLYFDSHYPGTDSNGSRDRPFKRWIDIAEVLTRMKSGYIFEPSQIANGLPTQPGLLTPRYPWQGQAQSDFPVGVFISMLSSHNNNNSYKPTQYVRIRTNNQSVHVPEYVAGIGRAFTLSSRVAPKGYPLVIETDPIDAATYGRATIASTLSETAYPPMGNNTGLFLGSCANVIVRNIKFDKFAGAGIQLLNSSAIVIEGCEITRCGNGIQDQDDSPYSAVEPHSLPIVNGQLVSDEFAYMRGDLNNLRNYWLREVINGVVTFTEQPALQYCPCSVGTAQSKGVVPTESMTAAEIAANPIYDTIDGEQKSPLCYRIGGNVIRRNYIHDLGLGSTTGRQGIFLTGSARLIEENIISNWSPEGGGTDQGIYVSSGRYHSVPDSVCTSSTGPAPAYNCGDVSVPSPCNGERMARTDAARYIPDQRSPIQTLNPNWTLNDLNTLFVGIRERNSIFAGTRDVVIRHNLFTRAPKNNAVQARANNVFVLNNAILGVSRGIGAGHQQTDWPAQAFVGKVSWNVISEGASAPSGGFPSPLFGISAWRAKQPAIIQGNLICNAGVVQGGYVAGLFFDGYTRSDELLLVSPNSNLVGYGPGRSDGEGLLVRDNVIYNWRSVDRNSQGIATAELGACVDFQRPLGYDNNRAIVCQLDDNDVPVVECTRIQHAVPPPDYTRSRRFLQSGEIFILNKFVQVRELLQDSNSFVWAVPGNLLAPSTQVPPANDWPATSLRVPEDQWIANDAAIATEYQALKTGLSASNFVRYLGSLQNDSNLAGVEIRANGFTVPLGFSLPDAHGGLQNGTANNYQRLNDNHVRILMRDRTAKFEYKDASTRSDFGFPNPDVSSGSYVNYLKTLNSPLAPATAPETIQGLEGCFAANIRSYPAWDDRFSTKHFNRFMRQGFGMPGPD